MKSLNFKYEFKFFETSWSPCGLCWYAINGSNRARKVKVSRCMFSFTDVCSIRLILILVVRIEIRMKTNEFPTKNTDTNDNYPIIDQAVMVWKRTRKSFSVWIFPMYIGRWIKRRNLNCYVAVALIPFTIFRISIIFFQIKFL